MPARGGGERAAAPDQRSVEAVLRFARGGGRTFLRRQSVPYPFHVTRPHALDAGRPDVATLILQSAAGGLYRDDRLLLDVAAGEGARVEVRSQAATVVHAAAGRGIAVGTRLDAAPGAVLAVSTDPYILFPDTALSVRTDIRLAPGATVLVAEGFATHDPLGADRPFGRLSTRCRVARPDGTATVDERSAIDGPDFAGPTSPLGRYRAMGTVMVLGEAAAHLDVAGLERDLDGLGVLGGATRLPNGAGLCVRLLAAEGGRLGRGLDAAVAAALAAAFGGAPTRRR